MEQYLRLYAEPEIAVLGQLPAENQWSNVLVIPACNETDVFLRPPPPSEGRSLMILVINESASASNAVSSSNQALADSIAHQFEFSWKAGPEFTGFGMCLFEDQNAPRDILIVDRFSKGKQIPARGGVGHARKIGADLAASLIEKEKIRSPWIHCSDADVQLPETYFTFSHSIEHASVYSALVYPYRHSGKTNSAESEAVAMATQLYEESLRYYVAGLKFAGSPYAFHTIGSTMVVNAKHYAKVRGFPKREAAEDFYLLNKLAKVGQVLEIDENDECRPIRIRSRRSDRVPFGTGDAVNKILALTNPQNDFRFYHPEIFSLLKIWIEALPGYWNSGTSELKQGLPCEQRALLNGLIEIGTKDALAHAIRQSKDPAQFLKQMHTWFDAFRTLKLIHYLRDHQFPSVSFSELIKDPAYQAMI
jgi:hypothetical protein